MKCGSGDSEQHDSREQLAKLTDPSIKEQKLSLLTDLRISKKNTASDQSHTFGKCRNQRN
jgi:hypothetical protein